MNTPMLILITGVARSGKDTLANSLTPILAHKNRVRTIRFADMLKRRCDDILRQMGVWSPSNSFFNEDFKVRNRDMLVAVGRTARSIDRDVFVRQAWNEALDFVAPIGLEPKVVIIPDWRYLNEHDFMVDLFPGRIIRIHIQRPGYGPANEEEDASLRELFGKVEIEETRIATNPAEIREIAIDIISRHGIPF